MSCAKDGTRHSLSAHLGERRRAGLVHSAGAKAAPPSGEGRGRKTGTLVSPVLEVKHRTFLSEP